MRKLTVLVMAAILTISAAGIPDETVTEEIPWCWDVPGYSECIDYAVAYAEWICVDQWMEDYCKDPWEDPFLCFDPWYFEYHMWRCIPPIAGPITVQCQLDYCYLE